MLLRRTRYLPAYQPLISLRLSSCTTFSSPPSPTPFQSRHQHHHFKQQLALLLQGPVNPSHLHQIHARVFRLGADQDNLIATLLIGRHRPRHALCILNHLHSPSIFPFNSAIRIISDAGLPLSAFSVFKMLKSRSVLPNDFTFSFLLKACLGCPDARKVSEAHTCVVKSGFDSDLDVCSGLLVAYAKGTRDIESARKVFDRMPERKSVVCWTCLIAEYVRLDFPENALALFERMVSENVTPSNDTMVSVLSACSRIKEVEKCIDKFLELCAGISDSCCDSIDILLIYLYGKCGKIEESRNLFEKMSERRKGKLSVIAWNSMISGYVQTGHPVETFDLFRRMVTISDPRPNHVTVVSMLSACSQVGDIEFGKWAHNYLKTRGNKDILQKNTILATAFVDMYSKCGYLQGAKEIFDGVIKKDVVIYNAMIMGLAINGNGQESIQFFHKMKRVGLHPNEGTFLGLLCACTHSGFVHNGRQFFNDMEQVYSISPKLEHYSCYIDLLARAGHIDEALDIVKNMPVEPNAQVWGALLVACFVHSRKDIAQYIVGKLVGLEPRVSSGYVMLSNAYAADLLWEEIADLRGSMKKKGVRKQPGCSWIKLGEITHEFFAGCKLQPQTQGIYSALENLYRVMAVDFH